MAQQEAKCPSYYTATRSSPLPQLVFQKGGWLDTLCQRMGVVTDPEKLDTISKLSFSTTKKALHGFLSMVGYYRMFIHMFAAKTCPLT